MQLLALADTVCSKSRQSKTEIHTHIPEDFQFICRHSRISIQNKVSPLGLRFSDGREMKTFVLIVALALLCPGFMLTDVEMQRSSLNLSREHCLILASSCNNDRQRGGRDSSSMWSVLHDDVDTLRKPRTADEASQAVKTRCSAFYRNE